MNPNIECLMKALAETDIEYKVLDPEKNFVRVGKPPYLYFNNHKIPLNTEDVLNICADKAYTYYVLKDLMRLPKTKVYLDPWVKEQEFIEYLKFNSIEKIIADFEEELNYPVIVKKNRGYLGINVFLCENRKDAEEALLKIFDRNSRDFDYIALVQENIEPAHEYRVIVLDGEIQFMYEKDISGATFTGNLSPLHYEGGKAVLIEDEERVGAVRDFIAPIFGNINLKYGGLDVILDEKGDLALVEINSYPGFRYFIRDNGPDKVVDLYRKVLKKLA